MFLDSVAVEIAHGTIYICQEVKIEYEKLETYDNWELEVSQSLCGGRIVGFLLRIPLSLATSCAINLYGEFTPSIYAEVLTVNSRNIGV